MDVRTLPLESLVPAPYNPRRLPKPSDPAYRKLRRGLEEFGFVEPLVWNEVSGHVVGGHLRLTIARELGLTEVPVSVVRLDPAREKALNVLLNNAEAQGRWDRVKLAELLTELRDLPELELTGFDGRALAALEYEPSDAEPAADALEGRVEVVLTCDAGAYERAQPALDALVREHGLEARVRR